MGCHTLTNSRMRCTWLAQHILIESGAPTRGVGSIGRPSADATCERGGGGLHNTLPSTARREQRVLVALIERETRGRGGGGWHTLIKCDTGTRGGGSWHILIERDTATTHGDRTGDTNDGWRWWLPHVAHAYRTQDANDRCTPSSNAIHEREEDAAGTPPSNARHNRGGRA